MAVILPYDKRVDKIIQSEWPKFMGAFVLPNGDIKLVDEYISYAFEYIKNKLNDEQQILWDMWLDAGKNSLRCGIDGYSRFLLQVCNMDIINFDGRTIVTTDPCEYIKYFNWYLAGFDLGYYVSMKPDEYGNGFASYDKECLPGDLVLNRQYKKDADDIKSRVLYQDISKYFRE